jgi:opacity protein-like surface antigen
MKNSVLIAAVSALAMFASTAMADDAPTPASTYDTTHRKVPVYDAYDPPPAKPSDGQTNIKLGVVLLGLGGIGIGVGGAGCTELGVQGNNAKAGYECYGVTLGVGVATMVTGAVLWAMGNKKADIYARWMQNQVSKNGLSFSF